jgi:hypothetical protein
MQVFTVRGLDRVSAEIRAAELRVEGHQTELVPVRNPSGSYNIVYWTTPEVLYRGNCPQVWSVLKS